LEILAIVNPIMDNLMAGSTEIDHAKHTRDFTDRLKAIVGEVNLQEICKRYQAEWGFFAGRECVAIFRRPESVAVIWKQSCTKQAGEFVAELVLVEQNGQYLVDHVMVY
jgi:hypothetical protein